MPALASTDFAEVHNANHFFNSIYSSMRQWGSSLNHNGMTVFLATVPAGTQLYHGTTEKKAIQGMQWLAFEPEHARISARPRRGRPPPRGHRPSPLSEDRHAHGEPSVSNGQPKRHRKGQGHRHDLTYKHGKDAEFLEGQGSVKDASLDTVNNSKVTLQGASPRHNFGDRQQLLGSPK